MNGFITLSAALLLLVVPHGALPERVDLIEDNTVLCEDTGREVIHQHILWDFHQRHGKHHVAAWKLFRGEQARRSFVTGEWLIVLDGKEYRAPTHRESFSTFDPELYDRNDWPTEKRRLAK